MTRLTALELQIKSNSDLEMIQIYKKQIAQLAACIADREGRISRRQPIIERISEREKRDFLIRLNRAKDDAIGDDFVVGAKFRSGADKFEVTLFDAANGIYSVQDINTGRSVVAGKDLQTIAEVFFFDYPAAILLK